MLVTKENPKKQVRVLIGGVGYGMNNVGDEGILAGIIQDIRDSVGTDDITVLTWKPQVTEQWLGVRSVRPTTGQVLKEISRADLIICGGASIIAEYYNKRAFITERLKGYPGYPLAVVTIAKWLRKKVMIYAVGVEPIKSIWFRKWVCLALKLADVFTVRDEASKELLEMWGDASSVVVAADPAFNLAVPPEKVTAEFLRARHVEFPPDALRVGIGFAYEPQFVEKLEEQIKFLSELGRRLIEENQAYLVFIPMNTDPSLDRQGLERIAVNLPPDRVMVLEGSYEPAQVIGLVSRLDLVISSRMHLLIFAVIANTPFAAISRGPKIDAFAQRFRAKPVAHLSDLDVLKAKAQIDEILRNADQQRQILSQGLAEIRRMLDKNRALMRDLAFG